MAHRPIYVVVEESQDNRPAQDMWGQRNVLKPHQLHHLNPRLQVTLTGLLYDLGLYVWSRLFERYRPRPILPWKV